ncbi:MAG: cell division protein ZapA [Angelakisella sp.]|nr:cell division protein ZapA [Angelakisella sp.]
MANRMKVTIAGSSYYISTEDGEARMRQIEEKLNKQFDEIREARPNLSALDIFVLLSLNLTDELSAGEESTDRMREQLTQYLEDAARARMELDEARRDNDSLRKKIDELHRRLEESDLMLQQAQKRVEELVSGSMVSSS